MSTNYPARAIAVLDDPRELWSVAFSTHLTPMQQALLTVVTTLPARVDYNFLRVAWSGYCDHANIVVRPGDFDGAAAPLEGTFVAIERSGDDHRLVDFHNPSVADFMLGHLASLPEIVQLLVESSVFFTQLERLHSYSFDAQRAFPRMAAPTREGIQASLADDNGAFIAALQRTFASKEPGLRWDSELGRLTAAVPTLERRLLFLLRLEEKLQPPMPWILAEIQALLPQWREGEGNKGAAVQLHSEIRNMGSVDGMDMGDLQDALSSLLHQGLDDMTEDWVPLLDFAVDVLDSDGRARVINDFEDFVRDELARWDPAPPDLEELTDYAGRFGLMERLEDEFELASERLLEEDRAASENSMDDDVKRQSSTSNVKEASDEELDVLFVSLLSRPPGKDFNAGT